MSLVERTHPVEGGGDGDRGLQRQLTKELVSVEHTLPRHDHRLLSLVDYIRHRLQVLDFLASLRCQGWHQVFFVFVAGVGVETLDDDILGQVDQDRALLAGVGVVESFVDNIRKLLDTLQLVRPLRAGPYDVTSRTFLEGVSADGSGGDLTDKGDHWCAVGERVLQRGHKVGGAGSTRRKCDTGGQPTPRPRITLRRVTRALLAGIVDEFDCASVKAISDWQHSPPRVSEHVGHAILPELLLQNLTTVHSGELLQVALGVEYDISRLQAPRDFLPMTDMGKTLTLGGSLRRGAIKATLAFVCAGGRAGRAQSQRSLTQSSGCDSPQHSGLCTQLSPAQCSQ
eukprot:Hpha_TRINITY_DN15798_c2_g5::TRINITY_DN15798_c2_g5_i1::g.40459::m.40459